jgi:hypothetical protein
MLPLGQLGEQKMKPRLLKFSTAIVLLAALSTPAMAGKVCRVAAGLLADTDCQPGDNVKMSSIGAGDLPDTILRFCDISSQVLTFPDTVMPTFGSEKNYVVLCKFHER